MDRINLLIIFIRVVETASFTKASATLNIPRSTISTAISTLESNVGTRLLSRTTRKVAPTQDGVIFYQRCLRLIADFEEIEALFQNEVSMLSGKIHIDMPSRIGRLIVAPALPQFFEQFPHIEVQLGLSDRAVDLISENVDCVLRVGTLNDSELVMRHIGLLRIINVASPAYLAKYGIPQVPSDLHQGHLAVNYASPTTGRTSLWEWVESDKLKTMILPSQVTVNNAEGYIACCLAGLGIIQIPAYDVNHCIIEGELTEVLHNYTAPSMPITLLYPHKRHLSQRLHLFIDWLINLLEKQHVIDKY